MEHKEKEFQTIQRVKIEEIQTIITEKEQLADSEASEEKVEYAFVFNSFFEQEFNDPEEVLDKNKGKVAREARAYVCIKIEWERNTFLLPLRRDLANMPNHPLFKKACYPVPSTERVNAGLDFRKIIVVNDDSLYKIEEARISSKQKKIIQDNFEEIKEQAIAYIKGFKKSAKKNRQKRDSLYKYSALNNFLEELGI